MSEYTCTICGKQVSKRQSYAHNGGRACKEHAEAQTSAKERETAVETQKLEEKKREEERAYRRTPGYHMDKARELNEWSMEHCWCCGKPSFTRQQYGLRMMVAMEKVRQLGENVIPGLLGNQKLLVEQSGLQGRVPVTQFVIDSRDHLYRRDLWEVAQLMGVVIMCKHCAEKSGRTTFDARFMPEITEQQLHMGVVMSEILKPEVNAIATDELDKQTAP